MNLSEIVKNLDLVVCCGEEKLQQQVTGGYVSDLLSDVIANSAAGNVWATMQVHVNIVAVAVLKELAAIILVQGRSPAEDTLRKAREENVTILSSKLPAYETAGRLYELGIGSRK
ncbi:MAG: serine kinase [Ignavibacteria bacterium]|nr:serine kinase [Ignavibacteria bacterium]